MNDYRLYMFHDEGEVTDGGDVCGARNIFKAVCDQFQMIDLESRAFICLDNNLKD